MNQIYKSCWAVALAVTFWLSPSIAGFSQCDSNLTPSDNKALEYKKRGKRKDRCEGFYSAEIGANDLKVVGFTIGEFRFKDALGEVIYLSLPDEVSGTVNVRAIGTRPKLYYQMDTKISGGAKLQWEADEVLRKNKYSRNSKYIGLFGYSKSDGRKRYVPLYHSSKLLGARGGTPILYLQSATRIYEVKWRLLSRANGNEDFKHLPSDSGYRAWSKIPIHLPKGLKGRYWVEIQAQQGEDNWKPLKFEIEL